MMIPILKDHYEPGYLPRPTEGSLPAFFPNVNLAARRRVFEQVGPYDEECRAGEDADLCLRASRAGWDLFYEPTAVVRHEGRSGVWALVRQWWWYAYSGSRVFEKAQRHRCEVYVTLDARPRVHRYRRVLCADRFPFRVLVFLSWFPLAHLGALSAALLWWAGARRAAAVVFAALAVWLLALWRRSSLRRLRGREILRYCALTWVVNATSTAGSLIGGLRRRMLYLFPGT